MSKIKKIKNQENILKAIELLRDVAIETEDGELLDIKFFNFEAFDEKNFIKKVNKDIENSECRMKTKKVYGNDFHSFNIKYCHEKLVEEKYKEL